MTLPAPIYDLVLMLDLQADDATRAAIVADSRAAIEAQGELVRHDEWGERPLTYPIDRKTAAEYHLLQFHASSGELLSGLDRTLRIADAVLRFRIIKLKPGVPDPPDMGSVARRGEAGPPSDSAPPSDVAAPSGVAPASDSAPPSGVAPASDSPAPADAAPPTDAPPAESAPPADAAPPAQSAPPADTAARSDEEQSAPATGDAAVAELA